MRDQSLTLRILMLAVLLPIAAAVCVVVLVVTGTLHPRVAHMVAAGGVILILAVLASAVSALGPKYRPTPFLTPLLAGVFAALLVTATFYAVHAHVAPKRSAVAAVQPKPVKTAPVIEQASAPPALAAMPKEPAQEPAMEPSFDAGINASPEKTQGRLQADVQPMPENTADAGAMGGPLVDVANAVVPPAHAAEKAAAGDAPKRPVVMAKIPVPATAPADAAKPNPDAPLNLTARFDPTGPTEPAADGPPMALDVAADAAPAHSVIPPLPHIRPCGGAGPACP